jgi:hypothetical protein
MGPFRVVVVFKLANILQFSLSVSATRYVHHSKAFRNDVTPFYFAEVPQDRVTESSAHDLILWDGPFKVSSKQYSLCT